ncbi:MAG: MopE-related protein, partial [Byssovorax sp.]
MSSLIKNVVSPSWLTPASCGALGLIAAIAACSCAEISSGGTTSVSTGGQGGAPTSGQDSSGSSWGTGADCSVVNCADDNPCTIDTCEIGGWCSHVVDPCTAGHYCDSTQGCVAYPACTTSADCEAAWTGDACKTGIACDAATSLCTFDPLDKDQDGHPAPACGGDDCDDDDAARFPGNPEVCDGKDNGCNHLADERPTCTLVNTDQSEGAPVNIAVDANNVYWVNLALYGVNTGSVRSVPLGGGPSVTLATGQNPWGLAVDATSIYWTNQNFVDGTGTLMKLPLGGGAPITLASGSSMGDVVVDATSVYWSDAVAGGGTLMKMPVGGGAATTLASGVGARSLALDAASVYWTDSSGKVMKVPVGGGAPVTLASGQDTPADIAVDANNVYWTTVGNAGA